MTFSEQINAYAEEIGFNSKDLAAASGLSESTVCNYRNGKRAPKLNSEKIPMAASGIAKLAAKNSIQISEEEILSTLEHCVSGGISVSYSDYICNLHLLLKTLNISNARLSRNINYDPSQLSRFLSGERTPNNLDKFTSHIASYIANSFSAPKYYAILTSLFGCDESEINTPALLYKKVVEWLGSNIGDSHENPIDGFLDKLDEFDLNDFISAINFDGLKLPTMPFTLPKTNCYHGIEQFKQAEFDFIKAAVLSKSTEDMILYSDMPISEMSEDKDFSKKYMLGMAMLLKKGLHINFIHDVHRPFNEMLLGLEANIPMYMTGQISPYYFSKSQNDVFCHLLKVSGTAAMYGSAISGEHKSGTYIVTKNKNEVTNYRLSAEAMLKRAKPLMEIYRSDNSDKFIYRMNELWQSGSRRMIFTNLPLFTISKELLIKILNRSNIEQEKIEHISSFRDKYLKAMSNLLKENSVTLEIAELSEEKFKDIKPTLNLSHMFYEQDVTYTYEEYTEHLQTTKDFAAKFENCILKADTSPPFKNISFSIINGSCVVVSKSKSPAIHFIIHHPKMIKAFENFVPPIKD